MNFYLEQSVSSLNPVYVLMGATMEVYGIQPILCSIGISH